MCLLLLQCACCCCNVLLHLFCCCCFLFVCCCLQFLFVFFVCLFSAAAAATIFCCYFLLMLQFSPIHDRWAKTSNLDVSDCLQTFGKTVFFLLSRKLFFFSHYVLSVLPIRLFEFSYYPPRRFKTSPTQIIFPYQQCGCACWRVAVWSGEVAHTTNSSNDHHRWVPQIHCDCPCGPRSLGNRQLGLTKTKQQEKQTLTFNGLLKYTIARQELH